MSCEVHLGRKQNLTDACLSFKNFQLYVHYRQVPFRNTCLWERTSYPAGSSSRYSALAASHYFSFFTSVRIVILNIVMVLASYDRSPHSTGQKL